MIQAQGKEDKGRRARDRDAGEAEEKHKHELRDANPECVNSEGSCRLLAGIIYTTSQHCPNSVDTLRLRGPRKPPKTTKAGPSKPRVMELLSTMPGSARQDTRSIAQAKARFMALMLRQLNFSATKVVKSTICR